MLSTITESMICKKRGRRVHDDDDGDGDVDGDGDDHRDCCSSADLTDSSQAGTCTIQMCDDMQVTCDV